MPNLPLVLHILPYDLPRGAQRYARAMRLLLDGQGALHRTLCLFESVPSALHADINLSIRKGTLARFGLEPRALVALQACLSDLQPAIVVAHGSEPLKYLAPLRVGGKVVYYKIGIAHRAARAPARRLAHAALLRRANVLAGVSQECLDEARDFFGFPKSRLVLVPNGRDPRVFYPDQHDGTAPTIVFVGHISASKRPGLFVEVIRRLRGEGVALRALLVGVGPLLEDLRVPAAAAGVELLGKREDIPEILRQSDIFVFTSLAEGEGMPGVLIEAGLSGLPIVSTDVPGARTCVLRGETGYVVPIADVEQLATRVKELALDASLRRAMGAAARDHCAAELSLEASTTRWRRLIDDLLVD